MGRPLAKTRPIKQPDAIQWSNSNVGQPGRKLERRMVWVMRLSGTRRRAVHFFGVNTDKSQRSRHGSENEPSPFKINGSQM